MNMYHYKLCTCNCTIRNNAMSSKSQPSCSSRLPFFFLYLPSELRKSADFLLTGRRFLLSFRQTRSCCMLLPCTRGLWEDFPLFSAKRTFWGATSKYISTTPERIVSTLTQPARFTPKLHHFQSPPGMCSPIFSLRMICLPFTPPPIGP